jgi:hypothetical protein
LSVGVTWERQAGGPREPFMPRALTLAGASMPPYWIDAQHAALPEGSFVADL